MDVASVEQLPVLVGRLTAEDADRRERVAAARRLVTLLRQRARTAGATAVASGRWLVDLVVEHAPHVPVRDLETLQRHHGGRTGDDLARALVAAATRTTSGIGAAAGALATLELSAPPLLLSLPVQLVVETLAVTAVELKLVAELHQVYQVPVRGTRVQRAAAYLDAWAHRRGVDPADAPPQVAPVVSAAARRDLRKRLLRRTRRNTAAFAPFLAGAVAGAEINRRETRRLAEALMRDLRLR